MRKYIAMMLVLLGGTTTFLHGQNDNSFGIRIGTFNPTFATTKDDGDASSRFAGDLRVQLVRDWATGEAGFWRGRVGLSLAASRNPLGVEDAYSRTSYLGASIFVGRGRQIDLAPFSLSYGGEVGLGVVPHDLGESYFRSFSGGTTYESTTAIRNVQGRVSAGVFLQLDWNIHRNIWIGMEQRFIASAVCSSWTQTNTFTTTPTGGSASTNTTETQQSEWNFLQPFQIPYPLLSITFRPGGK